MSELPDYNQAIRDYRERQRKQVELGLKAARWGRVLRWAIWPVLIALAIWLLL